MMANEIELEPLPEAREDGDPILGSLLPVLGSVKVRVTVRLGQAQATAAELLALKEGGVLELDRTLEQPLDVVVDDHVVARGILVAVGDHFGVRITEAAIGSGAAR